MDINGCSPFLRAGLFQKSMYCGKKLRRAFDCRLIYISSGSGSIIFEKSEIPVSEGTAIYIPVAHPYRFSGELSDLILNFDFTQSFSHIRQGVRPVETPIIDANIFDKTLIEGFESPIVLKNMFILENLFEAIIKDYQSSKKYFEARCSVKIKEILIEILCSLEKKSKIDTICENTLSYIKANCATITSNDEIGKALGYNSIYLNSILKKKLNKTIHGIITEERVVQAIRLLWETDYSIEEIAYKVGFSSRNYFCTAFKQCTGYSPTEYRKS